MNRRATPRNLPNPEATRRGRQDITPERGREAPYRLAGSYPDGTACATCGVRFEAGRWAWPPEGTAASTGATITCPACARIRDSYAAGRLTLGGAFLATHRAEVLEVLRAEEALERAEHPMHRVISIEEAAGAIEVTTTDIHLPRRIADAIKDACGGTVAVAYAPGDEQVAIRWERTDAHGPVTPPPAPPLPLEVQANGIIIDPEADAYLRERIERLRQFHPRIIAVRVVLDAPHGHHQKGGPYGVAIHIELPGTDAHITRRKAAHLHVAIRNGFDAATRQLEDIARRIRGDVSPTVQPPRGTIARVFPADGYGFIRAADGHEVYFHANSLIDAEFERLAVGTSVRYHEEAGNDGPQASTVAVGD